MRAIQILWLAMAMAMVQARAETLTRANSIMVVVNDAIITEDDVKEAVLPSVDALYRQYNNKPDELEQRLRALQVQRLEELVAHQLILNDATNVGLKIPQTLIEDRIESRIRQQYGDRASLIKRLQAQGITLESYRNNVRDNLIITALRDKYVAQNIIISPTKINNFYQTNLSIYQLPDQIKLRTIVFNKPKDNPAAIKPLVAEVMRKIEEGAPFAEMAAIHSDNPKSQAATLEWIPKSALRDELASVAFSLKQGQRSDLIDTPEAYYLLSVEEIQTAHTKPLAEVRESIEKILVEQEQNRLYQRYLQKLRPKSFIRYF